MGRLGGHAMAVNNLTTCFYPQLTSEGSPRAPQVTHSSENRLLSGSNGLNATENGISYVDPSSVHSSGVVANCYVFKSRLQEYAQKAGIPTPVYDTLMEGPSHVPVFRSSVIVNNVKYDSLSGFFNRKAAEQSAAEVALVELTKSGQMTESIPTVHETGLCKNLLQEYAQKMNYAIPSYNCTKQATTGSNSFVCTVEIHGIQYIGAAAKTKKEAEIKAARTALLAIQSASLGGTCGTSPYTVIPGKKKGKETEQAQAEAAKPLKPKKTKFKKKWPRRRVPRRKKDQHLAKSSMDEAVEATSEDHTVKYLDMLDKEMKLQLQAQPGLYTEQ